MTDIQAVHIKELRMQGKGYKLIASTVGLSRDIVRNFCKSNGMEGHGGAAAMNLQAKQAEGKICFCCGKKISQPENGRRRKFCSDWCRRIWWKAHPEAGKRKILCTKVCTHGDREGEGYEATYIS